MNIWTIVVLFQFLGVLYCFLVSYEDWKIYYKIYKVRKNKKQARIIK
jgi:hypothetical protein